MDDFVLLLKNKAECKNVMKKIEIFLNENLKLQLNQKSRYYPSAQGLNFCGYRIWPTHRLLRTRSKRKIKTKVKKWNKMWREKTLDFSIVMPSLQSWIGHSSHANSYLIKQKILKNAEFLYDETKEYPCYDDFDLSFNDTLKCAYLDEDSNNFI